MNIFTNLIFTFVFLNIITYFNFPNINNDSYIKHKLMIFLAVFFFQISLSIIAKIKNNCKIVLKDIIQDSLMKAIFAVLGYSIYIDLIAMEGTKGYIKDNVNSDVLPILVSMVIVLFLAIAKTLEVMFANPPVDLCVKQV